MAEYKAEDLEVEPFFDLELFLATSQETRVEGPVMEALGECWERWLPHARARRVDCESGAYLLAWLEQEVEDDVDDKWEEAPSEAFLYNALAQVMCMGLVHSILPEVEEAGCAPAPRHAEDLADALEEEGVPYAVRGEPGLARRYAVVTYYPFRGGCEICALMKQCPKAGGGSMSITLPGHEK